MQNVTLRRLAATAVVACMAALGSAWAQGAPPPAEAYGRLPAIGDAAISPDGRRLALSVGYEFHADQPDHDFTAFSILNIDNGAVEHSLAPPPHNNFRGVGWADDGHPYYYISATGRVGALAGSVFRGGQMEYSRIGVFSLQGGDSHIMMDREVSAWANISISEMQAPITGDPGFARIVAWSGVTDVSSTPQLAVFRVDLSNGRASPSATGGAETRGFLLNQRGDVVARVDIDEQHNHWELNVADGGRMRTLKQGEMERGVSAQLYGVMPDGRLVGYIPTADPDEEETLVTIDPRTGVTAPVSPDGSPGIFTDPWTHDVIGLEWTDDLPHQRFFDPQMQAIYEALQGDFADGYATMYSWSADKSRILVYGEHADDAGAYYVYEPAAHRLRSAGKRYPALNSMAVLGQRQSIRFRARDGVRVPAYLTLPDGVDPHNLPLVLLVHGGPHARDTFQFDWWASFLASRGYAVLQVNYRGSAGFGDAWFTAGLGQWGGLMQTDVEDGMDALVRNGMVDRARVCIVGASYGGYSALAGATLTPDRYKCAASIAGVADPVRFLNDASSGAYGGQGMAAQWWRASMGADVNHLRAVSPIDHVTAVHIPILLMHGDEDSTVPFQQSQAMNDRLRGAGKNVRFVTLHGDDHGLSAAATRTQMLQELETFLAANLGSTR